MDRTTTSWNKFQYDYIKEITRPTTSPGLEWHEVQTTMMNYAAVCFVIIIYQLINDANLHDLGINMYKTGPSKYYFKNKQWFIYGYLWWWIESNCLLRGLIIYVVYILEHVNTHKHYNTICSALARPHTAPTTSSDRSHNDMYQHTPFLHPYLFFYKARTMEPFLSYRRRHHPS